MKYDFSGLWGKNSANDPDSFWFRIDCIGLTASTYSIDRPQNKVYAQVKTETYWSSSDSEDYFTDLETAKAFCESEAEKRLDEIVEFANKIRKAE